MSTLTQFLPQQGSVINSIQRGTFTILNGNSTGSASISSVDTSKALLSLLGTDNADNVYIYLSNATTIEAVRPSTVSTRTISYEVVEYK